MRFRHIAFAALFLLGAATLPGCGGHSSNNGSGSGNGGNGSSSSSGPGAGGGADAGGGPGSAGQCGGANGVASCSVTIAHPGVYTLTVSYAGNAQHLAASASALFVVPTDGIDLIFADGFDGAD